MREHLMRELFNNLAIKGKRRGGGDYESRGVVYLGLENMKYFDSSPRTPASFYFLERCSACPLHFDYSKGY